MQDYLNRKKEFRPIDEPTPFDIDAEISQSEMPFDD
jgi:hypothetical protein